MGLKVEIVDREGSLWSGQAKHVAVPSVSGDLGILPGHQPLLAVLRPGSVRLTQEDTGEEFSFEIRQGFVSVDHDAVTVVARRDLLSKEKETEAPTASD